LSMICQIKQVSQALRPRNWTLLSSFGQPGSIQDFREFVNNRSNIVEAATLIHVTDELERGRFRRCDPQFSAGRVFLDCWCPIEIVPSNKLYANFAAFQRTSIPPDHNLEGLRTMVSRAVEFCRAQQRDIVVLAEVLHEVWHELLGRQATEPSILGGNNDVESTVRISDFSTRLHAAENRTCGYRGYSEDFADILSREVMQPSRGEVGKKFGGVSHDSIRS
jgi:hypothetical protein